MLQTITAKDARNNFSDLIGSVYYGKTTIAVKKGNRVFAFVVNPIEYEYLKKSARTKLINRTDLIRVKNTKLNPSESMKVITKEVESVRSSRYVKS